MMAKPPKTMTQDEAALIAEVAGRGDKAALHPEDHVLALRRRTMLETLRLTGIRTVELVNLRAENIEWPSDENGSRCYLHLQVTKGDKFRTVPVPDACEDWLLLWTEVSEKWCAANAVVAEYVFHEANKSVFGKHLAKPMTPRAVRYIVTAAIRRALGEEALDRMSAHTFRSAYITNRLEKQVPLAVVSTLAGHMNPATTMLYSRIRPRVLHDAVADMS